MIKSRMDVFQPTCIDILSSSVLISILMIATIPQRYLHSDETHTCTVRGPDSKVGEDLTGEVLLFVRGGGGGLAWSYICWSGVPRGGGGVRFTTPVLSDL